MHDHLGHLNLVADKAIFADSWNEGCQKPSKRNTETKNKNNNTIPRLFERGGPSQDSLFVFLVFVHRVQIFHRVLSW